MGFLEAIEIGTYNARPGSDTCQTSASNILSFNKTATACLVGLSAALLALWTNTSAQAITRTRATIPTAALVFVASVAVFLLSWLEHERSLRPSFFLFCYLFLGVLLDLPRVRTVWMLGSDQLIPILMTCSLALRAVMLVLESIEKRSIIAARVKYSFEMTASTLSRATFLWLNPLFKLGYKKTLALDDLYPLDERLQAQNLYPTLAQAWGKGWQPKTLTASVQLTMHSPEQGKTRCFVQYVPRSLGHISSRSCLPPIVRHGIFVFSAILDSAGHHAGPAPQGPVLR